MPRTRRVPSAFDRLMAGDPLARSTERTSDSRFALPQTGPDDDELVPRAIVSNCRRGGSIGSRAIGTHHTQTLIILECKGATRAHELAVDFKPVVDQSAFIAIGVPHHQKAILRRSHIGRQRIKVGVARRVADLESISDRRRTAIQELARQGVPVTVADSSRLALRPAARAGLDTYRGDILDEVTEDQLDLAAFQQLIAATDSRVATTAMLIGLACAMAAAAKAATAIGGVLADSTSIPAVSRQSMHLPERSL